MNLYLKPGSLFITVAYLVLIMLCLCYRPYNATAQAVQPKGVMVLSTFDYSKIRLLDSRWKEQQDEMKNYYLRVPNDDLLKGFRQRMNKPTYGAHDMGGSYSKDIFSTFGQIISGLSRMYAATGDVACKEKVDDIISGWAACIDSNGYCFYTKNVGTAHYTYEKIVCGLVDAYTYTGNKDALKYLSVITDWAIKNLSRNRTYSAEWYTLPENLYRAYLITGDKKYYNFANEWEYTDFWNIVRDRGQVFDKDHKSYHAYSHLNTFSSAAMAYMVKGGNQYKQTIIQAYDFFNNKECFPSGGFGPNEALVPTDELLKTVYSTDRSFETQCGSWAIFKLSQYLITATGDARYGDWIEKMMYNGVGGSMPMTADGRVLYYSDYNPREGYKKQTDDPWACCTGTRLQAIADYQQLIYFKSNKGIFVNLFMPSVAKWNNVTLTQSAKLPAEGKSSFAIGLKGKTKPGIFSLNFRKPAWLKGPAVFMLNGNKITADTIHNWYTITRKWNDGDKLVMTLPIGFAFKSFVATSEYPKMLMYGPVAMAVRSGNDEYPEQLAASANPWTGFTPVPGENMNWHVNKSDNLLVRPFYQYKENEPYVILFDPAVKNRIGSHNITQTGDWHLFYQFTTDTGATITAKFKGTGFRFAGTHNKDAGKFSVMLDGKDMGEADQYGAGGAPFEYKLTGLKPGEHTVMIKVLAESNKNSAGHAVNFTTIEKMD